jgi:hypothetical protein
MKNSKITALLVALFTMFAMAAAPSAYAAASTPSAAVATQPAPVATTSTTTAKKSVDEDANRYAQRDAQAKKQKDYKGGDYLVVGISTGAAIIVLIIVLLLI